MASLKWPKFSTLYPSGEISPYLATLLTLHLTALNSFPAKPSVQVRLPSVRRELPDVHCSRGRQERRKRQRPIQLR